MSKAFALDLVAHGIRSNTIAPTIIETPMTRPFFEDPEFKASVLQKFKLGRLGTTENLKGRQSSSHRTHRRGSRRNSAIIPAPTLHPQSKTRCPIERRSATRRATPARCGATRRARGIEDRGNTLSLRQIVDAVGNLSIERTES